jgi:phospholipase C
LINKGIYRFKTVEDYIKSNALIANNVFLKYMNIKGKEKRYGKMASIIIKEVQNTTAGFLLDYY